MVYLISGIDIVVYLQIDLDPQLLPYSKVTSTCMKNIHVKSKIMKMIGKKLGGMCLELGVLK